ncbi:MAG: Uma2 family endonuclease [Gemmataceae bacterium]|nr:Uma2 family endonuclease [Gemmataceae bacterium]
MTGATLSPPSTQVIPQLVTAEEFVEKYSHDYAELIDGVLKEHGMPSLRHGQVCLKAGRMIGNFVEERQLGHTMSNDSHILIRKSPDTVRGPDLSFYSFQRLPPGPAPEGLSEVVPELVVEVRSPSNTWMAIFSKVGDYLQAGVTAILVLDPDGLTASVYRGTGQVILHAGDTLTLPDVLPNFAVPVAKFFE